MIARALIVLFIIFAVLTVECALPDTTEHYAHHKVYAKEHKSDRVRQIAADLSCIVDEDTRPTIRCIRWYNVFDFYCFKDHSGEVPVGPDEIQHERVAMSKLVQEYNKPFGQAQVPITLRNITLPHSPKVNSTRFFVIAFPHTNITQTAAELNCIVDYSAPKTFPTSLMYELVCFRKSNGKLRKFDGLTHKDVKHAEYQPPVNCC